MMSKLFATFEKINPATKAAAIFVISIILLYSPVIFLNQSMNSTGAWNLVGPSYSISKSTNVNTLTEDPNADFLQSFPMMKLVTNMILHGDLPLWNPYLGAGTPLAADTENYSLSPAMIGFLLPSGIWDVSLLLLLWIAGFSTFLYLQTLRLNFTSSILGGIFFMFSGALTWLLPHTSTAVFIFTPLILYSIEKIISTKSPKFIFLSSLAFASGILGAHIESILLQLILVGSYVFYRVFTIRNPTNFHYLHPELNNNIKQIQKKRLIILLFIIMSFIGGLGISSFFTIPVHEYLQNTELIHDTSTGTSFTLPFVLTSFFIPYVMGLMHAPWDPIFLDPWNSIVGYVGITVLFFSIFSALMFLKSKEPDKSIPLFFLGVGIFFMLKVIGIPGINNLGNLPILEYVFFPKHTSGIIPFCFVISAAFGVNYLSNPKINKYYLKLSLIISIIVIGILSIQYVSPFLSSIRDNQIYFLVQIVQSIFFLISAYFISEKIIRKKTNFLPLIYVTLLELFLYIPVGLTQIFMIYKFAVILLGIVLILFFSNFNNNLKFFNYSHLKIYLITSIFILTIVGGIFVSIYSPYGMPNKTDPFSPTPPTDFIKQNLGDKRIFSLDWALGPNSPTSYEIPTIGIMSAFNIDSFTKFNHNFLDQEAFSFAGVLGMPPWSYIYKPPQLIEKLSENKKYFDFLGVKYFTTSANLDDFMPVTPSSANLYVQGWNNDFTSNTVFQPNTWYHVVLELSSSGKVRTIYVNGELDKSVTTSTALNTSLSSLWIGARIGGGANIQAGTLLDEFKIYNTTLSSSQVTALYNQHTTSYLLQWLKYQNDLSDSSGSGNSGIINNGGTKTYVPGKIGQALRFDGKTYITVPSTAVVTGSADRSISFWIKTPSNFVMGNYIFGYGSENDNSAFEVTWAPIAGTPESDTSVLINSSEKNIVQEFKSPFERITAISIQLGTYAQKQHGNVTLILDSVPYHEIFHRESSVNTEDLIDGGFYRFEFEPLNEINNIHFNLRLKFVPSTPESKMAAFYYDDKHSLPKLYEIKNSVGGELKLNGSTSNGILAFYIHSDKFKPVFEYNGFKIYENPDVFPRTFLVKKYTVVEPGKAQDFLLKHPDFDLRNDVIIEKQLSSEQIDLLKSCTLKNSNANIISYSANKVVINTNSDCSSLLVLTDVYYPGWHADMDGKITTIYRADGLVRAILVPQGNHTIIFSYMPQSFVTGLTITVITAGILIGFFVYSKRKEHINGSKR